MVLRRRTTPYLFASYLPAILIVVVTFNSFLMKQSNRLGRISLLTTCLMSMITVVKNVRHFPSHDSTAVEDFVFGCFCFVFTALVEYGVIIYRTSPLAEVLQGIQRRGTEELFGRVHGLFTVNEPNEEEEDKEEGDPAEKEDSDDGILGDIEDAAYLAQDAVEYLWMIENVDNVCLVVIPIAFAIFVGHHFAENAGNGPYQ